MIPITISKLREIRDTLVKIAPRPSYCFLAPRQIQRIIEEVPAKDLLCSFQREERIEAKRFTLRTLWAEHEWTDCYGYELTNVSFDGHIGEFLGMDVVFSPNAEWISIIIRSKGPRVLIPTCLVMCEYTGDWRTDRDTKMRRYARGLD